jgi:hypothetical protein
VWLGRTGKELTLLMFDSLMVWIRRNQGSLSAV